MASLTPRLPRINHIVFVFRVVCLITICTGLIFIVYTASAKPQFSPTNVTVGQQTFIVTNVNDLGPGSLHESIINANSTPGTDKIVFNIPGLGVQVINLETPLPQITDSLIIDGTTQPGYVGAPLIELNGSNAGFASGLVITAGNTNVRGLSIGRFKAAGILLQSCESNDIQANYIGIDATGTVARPNNIGIQLSNSNNNLIGGSLAEMRNLISGNLSHGVELGGSSNLVQGNFIGTDAAGTSAIGNGASGVVIGGLNNLIGGDSPGTGNLISGNQTGISGGGTIQGNLIGTDVTGTSNIPNRIGIQGGELIGGLTPGARNVISGNSFIGVFIQGIGSKVQGNFIGTDITGTRALDNAGSNVNSFAADALIGGTVPEARNVIGGGILLGMHFSGRGVALQGNYIGTDVTGTRALGTKSTGVTIISNNNLIGGSVPGAQNVISGNEIGIRIGEQFGGPGNGNVIQGNLIGLNALGTEPLSNTSFGIISELGSSSNTIGGVQNGAANKVAFNGKAGIYSTAGSRNAVRGNAIFSNVGLGIDLGTQGVTPNDLDDTDMGANNLQNFPEITSVFSTIAGTTIRGSLNSTPNTTFQIDFYSSAALDPSGNGEGAVFLGTSPVTTGSDGDATINVTLPSPMGPGRVLTATATDPDGNTSEFSASESAGVNGNLQFSVSSIQVIEGVGVVNVTVLRNGGSSGILTIDYATVDGTATAPQDYTFTSGTLSFNEGETSKSFQIPIADDVLTEPDETFTVSLRNASSLETFGAPTTLVVTIQDLTTVPVLVQNDPLVSEGTGTGTEILFTFTLSAATGHTVSANYATSNLDATGGSSCGNPSTDYETASGMISIPPGNTSTIIIPVKICGDTIVEASEQLRITLSNISNATADPSHGIGTILDDDKLELILEESGPTADQAAALDALLFLRDPFRVFGIPDWFSTAPDRNTRVIFFVRNLEMNPGSQFTVAVEFQTTTQFFVVPAEDVRQVPNTDFTQVVVRLPDQLQQGTCRVNIRLSFQGGQVISNAGTIRIAP